MTIALAEAAKLSLLLDISAKAVDFIDRQQARRWAQNDLNDAYATWKQDAGIDYRIEADTDEWKRMMEATSSTYEDLEDAKRQEKNSEKRLRTSVYRYKAVLAEQSAKDDGLEPVPAEENNGLRNADFFAEHFP